MKNSMVCWGGILYSIIGVAALIMSPGFRSPGHLALAVILVLFLVFGQFLPYLFGWRIGGKVPFTKLRAVTWGAVILFLPLVLLIVTAVDETRFGTVLAGLFALPQQIILIFFMMDFPGPVFGVAAGISFAAIAGWLLADSDYYLARPGKADSDGEK